MFFGAAWNWAKDAVTDTVNFIGDAVSDVVEGIKNTWELLTLTKR